MNRIEGGPHLPPTALGAHGLRRDRTGTFREPRTALALRPPSAARRIMYGTRRTRVWSTRPHRPMCRRLWEAVDLQTALASALHRALDGTALRAVPRARIPVAQPPRVVPKSILEDRWGRDNHPARHPFTDYVDSRGAPPRSETNSFPASRGSQTRLGSDSTVRIGTPKWALKRVDKWAGELKPKAFQAWGLLLGSERSKAASRSRTRWRKVDGGTSPMQRIRRSSVDRETCRRLASPVAERSRLDTPTTALPSTCWMSRRERSSPDSKRGAPTTAFNGPREARVTSLLSGSRALSCWIETISRTPCWIARCTNTGSTGSPCHTPTRYQGSGGLGGWRAGGLAGRRAGGQAGRTVSRAPADRNISVNASNSASRSPPCDSEPEVWSLANEPHHGSTSIPIRPSITQTP